MKRVGFAFYILILSVALAELAGSAIWISDGNAIYPRRRQLFAADSELGYRLRGGFAIEGDDNRLYPGVDLRINRFGLRGPTPDARRSVLLLGDSVAFGFGLEARLAVAERLASRLPRDVQVLNAGVPGYNAVQLGRWGLELANRFEPEIVVILLNANDAQARYYPIAGGLTVTRYRTYPWESHRLEEQPPRPEPRRWLVATLWRRLRAGALPTTTEPESARARAAAATPRFEQRELRELRYWQSGDLAAAKRLDQAVSAIEQLVEALRRRQMRVVVARWPWRVAVTRDDVVDPQVTTWLEPLAAIPGVTTIDLTPALRQANQHVSQLLVADSHPSAAGHETIAAALAAALGPRSRH